MDLPVEKVAEKLGSKRAGLGGFVIYILWEMAETDPAHAIIYAILMVIIVLGFMVSEHIEKGRNGKDAG